MLLDEKFFIKNFGKLPMQMNSIRIRKFTNEIRAEIFCRFVNPKNCKETEFGFTVDVFTPTGEIRKGIKVNSCKALKDNPYYKELKEFTLRNMPDNGNFWNKLSSFIPLIQELHDGEVFEFKGKRLNIKFNHPDDEEHLEPIPCIKL